MDGRLVADCVKLWQAGEYQLKPLADHYRTVVTAILRSEPGLSALGRDSMLGGPYGPFRTAWQALADQAVETLRATSENLAATADVLILAADSYAGTDRDNAEAFEAERARIEAALPGVELR
ncbi:hypothetical protein [Actinoplanes xinjiangensis]|uniref:hypothetical protein n=1 Tax=Actinoplanes xinjiangensis TaxID=512350 RepID=UPI0034285FA5